MMTLDEFNKKFGGETPKDIQPSVRITTLKDFNAQFENIQTPTSSPVVAPQKKEPIVSITAPEFRPATSEEGTSGTLRIVTPKFTVKGVLGPTGEALNIISQSTENFTNRMIDMFDFATNQGVASSKDAQQFVAKTLRFGAATAGLAFTPFSAGLEIAKGVPLLKYPALAGEWIFGKLGEAGSWLGGKAVQILPVSQESKDIFMEPIKELGALTLPLIAVKIGPKALEDLSRQKVEEQTVRWQKNEQGQKTISTTYNEQKPTTVAKIAGIASPAINIMLDPLTTMTRAIQGAIAKGVIAYKAKGRNVDDPNVAKEIVNKAVKETPAEIPGVMEVKKVSKEGMIDTESEPLKIYTNQKLVLQNLIPGREDINWKKIDSLGKDTQGNDISARYEWDYKKQVGTVYYTKDSQAADLAHEFGHHFDRIVSSNIGVKFSDLISNYSANKQDVDSALVSFIMAENGGSATKKQIDAKASTVVAEMQKEMKMISVGEKRGTGEKFAEAIKTILTDPITAMKNAPTFTKFVQHALDIKGSYLSDSIKEVADKGGIEIRQGNVTLQYPGIEPKNYDILTYIRNKAGKFRDIVISNVSKKGEITKQSEGPKFTQEQMSKIKDLNKKIFGDESVEVTAQILTPEGMKALGSYRDGIIKVVDGQADATDTYYHEAVHKYMDVFLPLKDHVDLLAAGREKYKTKDLATVEEKIAEDFINYAKSRTGVVGTIKTIFDKLIVKVQKFLNNEDTIQAFYNNIITGQAQNAQFAGGEAQGSGKIETRGNLREGTIKTGIPVERRTFKGPEITTEAFNMDKINAPEDVVTILKDVAMKNGQFGAERRSATIDEMKDFSMKYLGDKNLYKNVPSAIRQNIGMMKSAEQTMVDMATDLKDSLANTDVQNATPKQMTDLREKLLKLETVTQAFSGARTEASHLLSSLKSDVSAGENSILRDVLGQIRNIGLESKTVDEFINGKNKMIRESFGEGLVGTWYSFLLSGPTTFLKNFVSTAGSTMLEAASNVVNNPKNVTGILSTLANGLRDGFDMAKDVATGKTVGAAEKAKFTKNERIPYAFTGPLKWMNNLRVVGRLLAASDTIFNEGLRQMEIGSVKKLSDPDLMKLAEARAKRDGYRGVMATEQAKEYVKTPEILIGDLADKFALEGTYNSKPVGTLGAVSDAVSGLTRRVPALKFVAPFTRIVANVLNRAIDWTPYGFTRVKTGEGLVGGTSAKLLGKYEPTERLQRQKSQQLARATIGTVAMAFAVVLASQDKLSGDGPKNYTHKNQLLDTGWRANSIKIGNTWMPYTNLGPLALALAIPANMVEAVKYNEVKQKDALGMAFAAVAGSASTIFDMSFLTGINDFMAIVSGDDPKKLEQFVTRTVTSIIDPNLFKQVGRMFDPTVYDPNTVGERILSDMRLAGMFGVNPKLNVFGEVVKSDRITAMQPVTEIKDPVKKFLAEKQLWISMPAKTTQIVTGPKQNRQMTPDEYYQYVQESGKLIYTDINSKLDLISRQTNKDKQQKIIDSIVDNRREQIKNNIQMQVKNNTKT